MTTVIKVENLSKQYRLGQVGTGTLSDDVSRWWHKVRGKEDPFLKVGELNDRSIVGKSNYVWSLKDISFEVKQGEVLGIIGKNGAGKSTLLKILSRVTQPTTGTIKAKGRIASLLEVGTGFHPELSGRENIFLNGAILGMSKQEIKRKFDEIVDFSGVERYIDTPVKRYSSGMYVRLAFSVAAHLDPEILIVDEVLAVGDAEFQKKCLGKMKDAAGQGRTVLFVSHNISAISSLCNKGILLNNGQIIKQGNIEEVVSEYMNVVVKITSSIYWNENERPGNNNVRLISINLVDEFQNAIHNVLMGQKFGVEIIYELKADGIRVNPGVTVYSSSGQLVCLSIPESYQINSKKSICKAYCWFPVNLLNNDIYTLRINAHSFYPTILHFDIIDAINFEIIEQNVSERKIDYRDKIHGIIRPQFEWNLIESSINE